MEKNMVFGIDSENERKTLISLIEIEHGSPKLVKKTLSEICKETKIKNLKKRSHKGENTHRGYQFRLLKQLIDKDIVKKDENNKYSIKPQFLDRAHSYLIQNKIKDSEKLGLFSFLESTVFGIKNNWLEYPEMHPFHESLVNALDCLYTIKLIKKIFLIRDFSIRWKTFLDSNIPLVLKYIVWEEVKDSLSFFDNKDKDEFLERQINILKQMGFNKEEIEKKKMMIKKQYNDFIVEFRRQIGYKPKKYKDKTNKKFDLNDEFIKDFINKQLNKKQKEQIDNIINWCQNIFPEEINNTVFFLDLGNINTPHIHFKIFKDYEEKLFRKLTNEVTFIGVESVLKNIDKDTIDDSLRDLLDISDNRNHDRFFDRFVYLFIKLIQRPFYQTFYKQLDKKTKEKIISILKKDDSDSKDKTDYELFLDYAFQYL